uniref:Uncharacterized protein n=1 Tax=Fagus sylvatica TaxID=28930 RepID=A0A2N9FTR9_FAGSY
MNFPLDDVKQLLIACADALSKNNMDDFNNLIALATNVVSVRGEAIERVGIYLIQGLLAKALEIGKSENYFYDRIRDEEWEYLIEELAARPGGASPCADYRGLMILFPFTPVMVKGLEEGRGTNIGRNVLWKHNIEIEFNGLPVFAPMVTHEMLESQAWGRLWLFEETLAYYLALFESIDENIIVQKYCLAREIVNLIACEEDKNMVDCVMSCFTKWSLRLKAEAGFSQYPLPADNPKLRSMHPYPSSGHYTVVEEDGALLLNWKGRNLISASAWRL